jgi:putative membrane-bound dehydrogenase-like protein
MATPTSGTEKSGIISRQVPARVPCLRTRKHAPCAWTSVITSESEDRMSRVLLAFVFSLTITAHIHAAKLRAGAAAIDITPTSFPVIVNGMFEERIATKALDPIFAKCIVLDDGTTRIALVVADSCMLPRDLLDEAKNIASKSTGIPTDRIMISATHTHSAPSSMGCLGSDADANYVKFLPPLLAKAIEQANANLKPARVGYAIAKAPDYTACRRWIFAPNQMRNDPFGFTTVRANMHPGYQNPGAMGPAGPTDPDLTLLSLQTTDGKPLALLANFSMHYFSSGIVSSDYFGIFAKKFATLANADENFVGIMSQGTSGDAWCGDYSKPAAKTWTIDEYSQGMAQLAFDACRNIEYRDDIPLAMKETKLALRYRVADEKRLAWSKDKLAALNGKKPTAQPDIYAREQLMLAENPNRELKLQAIRIGNFAIAAIPNEVYALTGLKIKRANSDATTMVIELANGSEGYIPPPEQHVLGGYTTWAARTAGLEVEAEPKIVEAILKLLGNPAGPIFTEDDEYMWAVSGSKPAAYYLMDEMSGPEAADFSEKLRKGKYEPGVVFYLEGPPLPQPPFRTGVWAKREINRSPHFAGGRMATKLNNIKNQYSIELWFYNCLSEGARPVTGYLFSRGPDGAEDCPGDHVGIGGTATSKGKLIFFNGNKRNEILAGNTDIPLRTWNYLVITRDGRRVTMYLNGNAEPEAISDVDITYPKDEQQFFIGGRSDNFANFEGKIDEVAIYDRALTPTDVAEHFKASGMPARANAAALQRDSDPKSPQEALKLLHVKNGYVIEQVAAEPLVVDPVAIDWGADGKLWVVEMADYPYGADGKYKPGGRIKFLQDTDGDGKYDKATLFMDNVNMPNGIITWRDGVIVTAAPEIFYAEDTNGDGKADVKKVLYKGFKEGNAQLRVNSLRFGLDNWLHCANGWSGGVISSFNSDAKLDLGRKDLRIRPDEGLIELESGVTQFGRNPDDWGNWFGCDNSHPLFHYVLEDRYLRRNPHVTLPDPKQQVIASANPKVYPLSREGKRYHSFEHAGHYTSACSAMIYRDELLFPRGADQHSFTCEPVHNLVQHNTIHESGPTFTAKHPADETDHDFVASEDPWFRPVMVRTGPDGALWIVDFYRYMIEHPDWLPPQGKAELMKYYRDGQQMGRIYRVYPKDKSPRPIPNLAAMNTKQLVSELENPSGWVRDKAQQMLIWKNNSDVAALILDLFKTSHLPQARLHSLCTLDGLGALQPATIKEALHDEHPALRAHAVRLAETHPNLLDALADLAKTEKSPGVRLQLACSLGEFSAEQSAAALWALINDNEDPYINGAILSSAARNYSLLVDLLIHHRNPASHPFFADLLRMGLGMNNRDAMAAMLKVLIDARADTPVKTQMEMLALFFDAAKQKNTTIQKLAGNQNDALSKTLDELPTTIGDARQLLSDPNVNPGLELAAIGLLGRDARGSELEVGILQRMLAPQKGPDAQLAAVRALGRIGTSQAADIMLQNWSSHSPSLRNTIADTLLASEAWSLQLLKAIEDKKVSPTDLDLPRRARLTKHSSPKVRELAAKVLAATESNRQDVIDANRAVLTLTGERTRGAKMFATHCAACHRVENVGTDIGPALSSVANWTGEALLTAILDPDRQVEPRYLSYTAKLNNNDEIFGIITAETGGGLTMKGLDGKDQQILRGNIKSLTCTNHSLMPMGFEQAMSKQELADLISFLQTSH